jgi:hypothetical protein
MKLCNIQYSFEIDKKKILDINLIQLFSQIDPFFILGGDRFLRFDPGGPLAVELHVVKISSPAHSYLRLIYYFLNL